MKKLIALLLALVMVLALTACGGSSAPATEAPATEAPKAEAPAAPEAPEAPADESVTVGLCNINEKGVFGKLVKYGFEQACAERGWTLLTWRDLPIAFLKISG